MFERFTDGARRALVVASNDACDMRHETIGTEHILLGVLAERNGGAARVLNEFGVTLDDTRLAVERAVERSKLPVGAPAFSRGAKRALKDAYQAMQRREDRYLDTEHLLLGVVQEGRGMGMKLLRSKGLDRTMLRQHITIWLNSRGDSDSE